MALSPVFDVGLGPLTVKQLGYMSPVDGYTVMRGPLPVSVPVTLNGVSSYLPDDKRLWWGLKLPGALKGDWLVLCELLQPDGGSLTAPYLGTLQLNNSAVRAAMHAEPADATAELAALACLAEIFYTDADGASNAVPGQNFSFTINAPLVNGTESITQSPGVLNPTASQVPINLGANATPVTKRTGAAGDLAALANVPTAGRSLGTLFSFTEASAGQLVFFRLAAGAASGDDADQVAPADYEATHNNVHFLRVPASGNFRPDIHSQSGDGPGVLAAILNATNTQVVEFIDEDGNAWRYCFLTGAANPEDDDGQRIVNSNDGTGRWQLMEGTDLTGEDYGVGARMLPGGLSFLAPGSSVSGQYLGYFLSGSALGVAGSYSNAVTAAGLATYRFLRYAGLSANVTQALPPIIASATAATPQGSVLQGFEVTLLNDDASHTVSLTVNGNAVVLYPGDRLHLTALLASATWNYALTNRAGPVEGRAINPASTGATTPGTGAFTTVSATGNVTTSSAGSSPSSPRTMGFSTLPAGTAARFTLGDNLHGFQLAAGGRTTVQGYWGIDICGNRQSLTPLTPAANGGDGNDYSLHVVGTLLADALIAAGPSRIGLYTLAGLPAASAYANYSATVSNPAAGKSRLVTSNGTNWLYQDGTTAA